MAHIDFSGTLCQLLGSATSTIFSAFKSPNPKAVLTQNPAPFIIHPLLSIKDEYSAVQVIICCMSLHVMSGLQQEQVNGFHAMLL